MTSQKRKGAEERNHVKTGEILGVPVFGGDRTQVLKELTGRLASNDNKVTFIATVNPEHIIQAQKDGKYLELLKRTVLNTADGIALVWAREIDRRSLTHLRQGFGGQVVDRGLGNGDARNTNKVGRVVRRLALGFKVGVEVLQGKYQDQVAAGSSLMDDLAAAAAKEAWGIVYLGGWQDRAKKTARYFEKKYPGLRVASIRGEPEMADKTVMAQIEKLQPEILLVAYGMKKQEEWIDRHLGQLEKSGVKLVMGVGRSFDYYSGDLKRAPEGWRKIGLEWLYSLIKEPKRWRRQLALVEFVKKVIGK